MIRVFFLKDNPEIRQYNLTSQITIKILSIVERCQKIHLIYFIIEKFKVIFVADVHKFMHEVIASQYHVAFNVLII